MTVRQRGVLGKVSTCRYLSRVRVCKVLLSKYTRHKPLSSANSNFVFCEAVSQYFSVAFMTSTNSSRTISALFLPLSPNLSARRVNSPPSSRSCCNCVCRHRMQSLIKRRWHLLALKFDAELMVLHYQIQTYVLALTLQVN